MSYILEWIGNDVFIEFSEVLNLDQLNQVNNKLYGDSRFDNMTFQIVDFTKVNTFNLTSNEVKIVSTLDRSASRWNKSIKVACITTNDYIKKMFLEYNKGMQDSNWLFMIFENIKDAKKWCSK